MRTRVIRMAVCAVICSVTAVHASAQNTTAQAASQKQLPTELPDTTFWNLISTLSESEQAFTTYMVSNETFYPNLVNRLIALDLRGGAYIGVAPEQNYHYIATIRPQIAFVLDIRRQAVIQHLMYKAIFELSPTRADFISLLFTKPKPAGIPATATAFQTWNAFWYIPTDTTKYKANFSRIYDHLRKKHAFPMSVEDSSLLDYTYSRFYVSGPNMTSNGNSAPSDASPTTFGNITSIADGVGRERSFLANEDGYQAVRQLHLRNMIVPIVGDFAGSHALRAIGRFLSDHNTQLTAFYTSNVETYLNRDGKAGLFYQNVATLPMNSRTVFISGVSPGRICNIQTFLASSYVQCA